MTKAEVDSSLLFGILALQAGLIEQADLLDAFQRWSREKARPLADFLIERGALTAEDRGVLESLLRSHLAKHGGQVERSLLAAAPESTVVAGLLEIGEPDLDRTLAQIARGSPGRSILTFDTRSAAPGDADATADRAPGLGESSSSGIRFRVLRPHARGGIGTVSVALDRELHREVALKEILPSQAENPVSRTRFLLEAEVTARLEHPGVVPVYGMGTNREGEPFYAMRLVRGETLKEAVEAHRKASDSPGRDPTEQALCLRHLLARFLDVCNTVAYAHSRGVIHRDLKPANIMLGPYGETLVVDWGLAKVVGRDEPSSAASAEATLMPASGSGQSETVQGTVIGTPAYMSPEQAEGRLERVGAASDVYSLGATLYFILTGRPPFEEPDVVSLLRKVQRGEFRSPTRVDRGVPLPLEAIVKKAMAVSPSQRYQSATELGGEVDHWLADEPVHAFREPALWRAARWARRHKPAVAALAVLLASAVVALLINSILVGAEKDRTEQQRLLAVNNFRTADLERRRAQALSANLTIDRGLSLCERGEVNRGLLWLVRALEVTSSEEDGPSSAIRSSLASWSRRLTSLKAILPHAKVRVTAVRFRPDGKTFVTADCVDGEPPLNMTVWDSQTGKPVGDRQVFDDPLAWINEPNGVVDWFRAAFRDSFADWISPDGALVLVNDGPTKARLREIATGRARGPAILHPDPIVCAAWSPDGSRFAIGGRDRAARIFLAATGDPAGKPLVHEGWVTAVAFSPDGKTLLTASRDGTARLWNAATGEPRFAPLVHGKDILRAALSPDGRTVLTAGFDNAARLWNAITGKPKGKPLVHANVIVSIAFSPDSKTVLTGSFDQSARLWDAVTGVAKSPPLLHESNLSFVTFSPDGHAAVTCGDDNSARFWNAETGAPLGSPLEHVGTVNDVAFSPDGKLLVTAGWDGEAQLWDTATSLSRGAKLLQTAPVSRLAFSPLGRTVLIGCWDGTAGLFDATTGRRKGEIIRHKGPVRGIAFSPDGTSFSTASSDRTLCLWEASTGRQIGETLSQPAPINVAAFSPDGATILTGDFDGVVRFWNLATHLWLDRTLKQTRATRIETITFSPDGRTIMTGSDDMTGRLWNAATGQPFGEVLRHQGSLRCAAFRRDGKLLVTGGWDKAIRFWDPSNGSSAAPPLLLESLIMDLALSSDGRRALVAFGDGSARIWDLKSGKPISPVFEHDGRVSAVAFRPDGHAALSGSSDGMAFIWEVPEPEKGTVARIKCSIEVLTRMQLSSDGMAHVLSPDEWETRRSRLDELDRPGNESP